MIRRVAVVTGSSRGIGFAIAKRLISDGYIVVINGRDAARLERAAALLGPDAIPVAADVSDYTEAGKLIGAAVSAGIPEVLINNAGIAYNGLFQDMEPADFEKLIDVNIRGLLNCARHMVPHMLKRKRGMIINVSSVWGNRGASCEAVYSLTKGGVDAFTRSLAKELGPSGIRVNAIACGVIDTEMNAFLNNDELSELTGRIALGRLGAAEEIAEMAAFLASDRASYVNGQVITVDGGMD